MSGFDLAELLPFYLDETDEQIAALNDALLKLEQDPSDAAVLREAFRMIHSIKGSSTVMGFTQVKNLTHHLETFFDRLRGGERVLDRATLDLSFRCLDALRDYHRRLRSGEPVDLDLSGLTGEVIASLAGVTTPAPAPAAPGPVEAGTPERETEPEPEWEPEPATPPPPPGPGPAGVVPGAEIDLAACLVVTVRLAPNLPWPDMKAKLVINRLAAKGRVLATDPASEQLETAETLRSFRVWVAGESDPEVLRAHADVEGVESIHIEPGREPEPETESAAPTPAPEPVGWLGQNAPVSDVTASRRVEDSAPATRPGQARPRGDFPETPTPPPAALTVPEKPAPAPPPHPATKKVAETLRVDVDRLDSLMNLAGELVINRARFYEIAQGLEELFRDSNARLLTADTEDRLEGLGHEIEAFAAASVRAEGAMASPVERWVAQIRRLRDNFAEIRRELDAVRLGRERVTALGEAIHQLARVTDGLQKGVLDTRMVPIGPLFERFHRVIRDLRVSSSKEVALRIQGEKTELDKRMIDELGDPLIHMVRNSVDHGLEPPDLRVAAGKPRSGTVTLSAMHRGNSVVITVSDDGRGIDVERIRRKVVEKGLVAADEAARLSDRQLVQFIWHPGLSTAEAITDISGRGVGMDIVKARIEGISGTVDVRTDPGAGTTFTIRLPLTLAILPCLLVRVFEEVYAIPLDHIDEIVEVVESQVFSMRGRRMIEIRGRLVSLVALDDVLTWSNGPRPAAGRSDVLNGKTTVVVAQNADTTVGLVVDQLLGMQEVVLKSLERNFRPVPSLSGASILGDGRVSLILDIDTVIAMVAGETAPQSV